MKDGDRGGDGGEQGKDVTVSVPTLKMGMNRKPEKGNVSAIMQDIEDAFREHREKLEAVFAGVRRNW
jgi:hypothetical protein